MESEMADCPSDSMESAEKMPRKMLWDYDDSDFACEPDSRSYDCPWCPWLKGFSLSATSTVDNSTLGSCTAFFIRRDDIRATFRQELQKERTEIRALAFDLFDGNGLLDDYHSTKGSGVWGPELGYGQILLIDSTEVDEQFRRQGMGTGLVRQMIRKVKELALEISVPKTQLVVFVQPGWHIHEDGRPRLQSAELREGYVTELQFYRSLGFRRVGNSDWFAFVEDPDHPSKSLNAQHDWDNPGDIFRLAVATIADGEISDKERVSFLERLLPGDTESPVWSFQDHKGHTMLHLAAILYRPGTARFLLVKKPGLAHCADHAGNTPVELLERIAEKIRTTPTALATGKMEDFTMGLLKCLCVLRGVGTVDSPDFLEKEILEPHISMKVLERWCTDMDLVKQIRRLMYGCTCGECLGGFYSQRMRHTLLQVAKRLHLSAAAGSDSRQWRVRIRQLIKDKELRARLFSITEKLIEEEYVPTFDNLLGDYDGEIAWPDESIKDITTKSMGGLLFSQAFDEYIRSIVQGGGPARARGGDTGANPPSPNVEGTTSEEAETSSETDQVVDLLPVCRNDHKFEFVASKCGFKDILRTADGFVGLDDQGEDSYDEGEDSDYESEDSDG